MTESEHTAQSTHQAPPAQLPPGDLRLVPPAQPPTPPENLPSLAPHVAPATTEPHTRQLPQFTHTYLREYIALADQKAAFTFAASAALLGYLVSRQALAPLTIHLAAWQPRNWLGFVAVCTLAMSATLAILVVLPRLRSFPERGQIFWDDILASSPDDYAKTVLSLHEDAADHQILLHCHTLARICQTKYRFLAASMWIAVFAFATTAAFLLSL